MTEPQPRPQQLSAADSLFLSLERSECPMTMGLLVMLDSHDTEASEDALLQTVANNIQRIDRLHHRIESTRLELDQPSWQANGIGIQGHIHRHRLAAPGNRKQLYGFIEGVMMKPLDRRTALWELHLITGLQNSKRAMVFKLHHAYADGINALRIFADTVADHNDGGNPSAPDQIAGNNRYPGPNLKWPGLWRFFSNHARILGYPVLWAASSFYLSLQSGPVEQSRPPQATRFTEPVGKRRSYAVATLPLKQVRQITSKYSSTDNELLMSLYSGALRRYLKEKGELPQRSLHAGMPYSMMHSESRRDAANQVGFNRITLGTRISDPVQRLRTVKSRCARALKRKPARAWQQLQALMRIAPPRLVRQAADDYIRLLRARRISPTFSAITTYMPGPVRRMTIENHVIEGIYPLGVLYHGCGLNLSAMRYGQNIHCGVVADRDMMPDPEKFEGYLKEEFEALYSRACAD